MSNSFYIASGYPSDHAAGASSNARTEFAAIAAGFEKLGLLTGQAGKVLVVNPSSDGYTYTDITTLVAGSGLETSAHAASTYQPIASMSAYLTVTNAASTYQTQAAMAAYLTSAAAATAYPTKTGTGASGSWGISVTGSAGSVVAGATDGTNVLGYKGLPAASVATGAFAAADAGKCVYATGGVTVPNSIMSAGDVVVIQETTGATQAITASVATLYWTATGATGARTLKARGRASIIFASATVAYISGDLT